VKTECTGSVEPPGRTYKGRPSGRLMVKKGHGKKLGEKKFDGIVDRAVRRENCGSTIS